MLRAAPPPPTAQAAAPSPGGPGASFTPSPPTIQSAPLKLQKDLNEFSELGRSCSTEIFAALNNIEPHSAELVLDMNKLEAELGPVRKELGEWQMEVPLCLWDCSALRTLLKAEWSAVPPRHRKIFYALSGSCLQVRSQTLGGALLVAPAMSLLSEFFTHRGVRCFIRQPSDCDDEEDDAIELPVQGSLRFTAEELFKRINPAVEHPLATLDTLLFGSTAALARVPPSTFAVMRASFEHITVWLFTDENFSTNMSEMNSANVDTMRLREQGLQSVAAAILTGNVTSQPITPPPSNNPTSSPPPAAAAPAAAAASAATTASGSFGGAWSGLYKRPRGPDEK